MDGTRDLFSLERVAVDMWVDAVYDGGRYSQRSANLSLDGIHFPNAVPPPPATPIHLEFTLPGDSRPTWVRGEVLAGGEQQAGMHIRFLGVDESLKARLRAFLERTRAR